MRRLWLLGAVLSSSVLSACGPSAPSKYAASATPEPLKIPFASSAEEALSWLSSQDRQDFENWKSRLIKNCRIQSVLDLPEDKVHLVSTAESKSPDGEFAQFIDSRILRERTGDSPLTVGENGEFALFADPVPSKGEETYHVESAHLRPGTDVNAILGESEKRKGVCIIRLFGQIVYKTDLLESLPVIAHYSRNKTPQPVNVDLNPPSGPNNAPVRQISGAPYISAVLSTIAATPEVFPFLQKRLGMTRAEVERYIRFQVNWPNHVSIIPQSLPEVPPFNFDFPSLYVGPELLKNLSLQRSRVDRFEWVIQFNPGRDLRNTFFFTNRSKNQSDTNWSGEIRLKTSVALSGPVTGGATAVLDTLDLLPAPYENRSDLAAQCFSNRLAVKLAVWHTEPGRVGFPTFKETVGPCRPLSRNLLSSLLSHEQSLADFIKVTSGLVTTNQTNPAVPHYDWIEALVRLGTLLIQEGKDPTDILSPGGCCQDIRVGSSVALAFHKRLLAELPNEAATFDAQLIAFAFKSAFRQSVISTSDQSLILSAISRAGKIFPISTRRLLNDLSNSYSNKEFQTALLYASQLDDRTIQMADGIRTDASAMGLNTWIDEIYSEFLQKRIPYETLAAWNNTLASAREFQARESFRGKDVIQETSLRNLVQKALAENWSDREFLLLEKIAPAAKNLPGCSGYSDASALSECLGLKKITNAKHGILDATYGGRYAELAERVVEYSDLLKVSFTQLRFDLNRKFWNPIWKSCGPTDFQERSTKLDSLIRNLMGEKEVAVRVHILQIIQDVLLDCDPRYTK